MCLTLLVIELGIDRDSKNVRYSRILSLIEDIEDSKHNLQMERLDLQVKLLEEYSLSLDSSFLENFNRITKEILSIQSGINHRTSDLHSDFLAVLSDLSLDMRAFNETMAELQNACVSITSSALEVRESWITDADSLKQEIENRVKALEELESKGRETRSDLQLREQCIREQLAHLKEMRELQKNRLKGELDSSYQSALQSLKRLRSEFEEAYTCEDVATSLAIETERRDAEKSHTACRKMFQSAENRIRRMETVRRQRLDSFHQTLDELRRKIDRPQASSSDEDPSYDLPSVLSAIIGEDDTNAQPIPAQSNLVETDAMFCESAQIVEPGPSASTEAEASLCRFDFTASQDKSTSEHGSEISGSDHCSTLTPPQRHDPSCSDSAPSPTR